MKCPKCQDDLHEMMFEGVDVDFCSSCKGIWFDEDEVAFLAELPQDMPDITEVEKEAVTTVHNCPRCETSTLQELKFLHTQELLLDRCPQCKGIWLDKGELPKIERIAARLGDVKSKVLLAGKQLRAKGYEVLGVQS